VTPILCRQTGFMIQVKANQEIAAKNYAKATPPIERNA